MKTDDLLQKWVSAKQYLDRQRLAISQAERELAIAADELGAFLSPDDAQEGESFQIWVSGRPIGVRGDVMLSVSCIDAPKGVSFKGRFNVQFRQETAKKGTEQE